MHRTIKNSISLKITISAGILSLLIPSNALAFVPHAYEGIYIHQMGHIFFFVSCVFIIWVIKNHNLRDKKGWRYIYLSQIFFVLWNIDTFVGHITEYWIEPSQIVGGKEGWDYFMREISIQGKEYLYYITKYEHILIMLAMFFFVKGLREHLSEEEKVLTITAILPLFPIMFLDMVGALVMIVLSIMCLVTAVRLYNTNRENVLWSYLLWLSSSHFVFSSSRSIGHILHRVLVSTGYESTWEFLEPYSGSLNTFAFVVIGSVSLFFFRAYQTYLKMSEDRKRIEIINENLAELNRELETMVAERTMSLMALTVADRVRNPAAVIRWTCKKMLEKEKFTEKMGENLKDIIDESEKLESIVRDFETLLKSKQSMFRYEEINEIVRGAITVIEREAEEKGIRLDVHFSDAPLKINSQKNLLRVAIVHIIRNSLEATPKGGVITIATSGDESRVNLIVSDTGSGIPEEDLAKIFDPFFSTKRFRFGMGLPLVKQIVSEHLGKIDVESTVGKGTTFRLSFPVRWMEESQAKSIT